MDIVQHDSWSLALNLAQANDDGIPTCDPIAVDVSCDSAAQIVSLPEHLIILRSICIPGTHITYKDDDEDDKSCQHRKCSQYCKQGCDR